MQENSRAVQSQEAVQCYLPCRAGCCAWNGCSTFAPTMTYQWLASCHTAPFHSHPDTCQLCESMTISTPASQMQETFHQCSPAYSKGTNTSCMIWISFPCACCAQAGLPLPWWGPSGPSICLLWANWFHFSFTFVIFCSNIKINSQNAYEWVYILIIIGPDIF